VHWVGTWGTAAQLTEPANLPPAPGLANRTLRQVFYVSVGGTQLRVHFSNAYGTSALELAAAHLALSTTADAIDPATDRALTFAGMPNVTIAPGASATSDVLDFALPPQAKLALSVAFGAVPIEVTGHPGSRTTSYIVAGDATAAASLVAPATTAHWYFATGIDVVAEPLSAAVVAFGDSITDGRGSTTDGNDRWPDDLSRRLRQNQPTAPVAVLNQGIGGNAVLAGGLGPTALVRFERDVLEQAGVRWVVVLHGVNDIGAATDQSVAQQLIAGYEQLVTAARSHGVRAYGVPILPFGNSMYDSPDHEAVRQTVNTWIRTAGHFDAVIDLDAAVRDPAKPAQLLAAYDDGDHLHPNAAGYQKMADTIDLSLFLP
jgi:lysophospholipase L1-like esterase